MRDSCNLSFAFSPMSVDRPRKTCLLDVLLQRLGVEVDLVAAVARLLQRLLLCVQPLLVLDEAVVGLEALGAAAALEGQRAVALAAVLFGLANIGASGSFVFYDALLPHVARGDQVDRLSTTAYALGYLGGGLLLALNLA